MERLCGVSVDEKRWKYVKLDGGSYDSYKFIDKKNENIYYFKCIIGIEQVEEDDFLVFRRANFDDFEIARYKLESNGFTKTFFARFNQLYFITDDRILLTSWGYYGPYRCRGIYSIKENNMLESAKWLEGSVIGIYSEEDNPKNIKLYVEDEICSYRSKSPVIMFTVDPMTLEPNSDCYSQFRDSFISVSTKEDINIIKNEDQIAIEKIENEMKQKEKEKLEKAKQKVLMIK